jgi:HD superfamily phosphohydrolase
VATRIFDAVWENMDSDAKKDHASAAKETAQTEERIPLRRKFIEEAKQDLEVCLGISCKDEKDEVVRNYLRKILQMAALFHDIGHLPLSHTFEDDLKGFFEATSGSGEIEWTINWVKGPALHEAFGLEIIRQILISPKKYGLDLNDNCKKIYKGALLVLMADVKGWWRDIKIAGNRMLGNSVFATLHDIISGEYDADRADYILRDGYMSGTGFGRYDLDRFVQNLRLYEDKKEERFKVVPTIRALSTLEAYLIERYKIYKWINSHHKVRFFEKAASEMAKMLFIERDLREFLSEKNTQGTKLRGKKLRALDYEGFERVITKGDDFQFPPFISFIKNGEQRQLNVRNFLKLDDLWFYCSLRDSSTLLSEDAGGTSENREEIPEASSSQQSPATNERKQNLEKHVIYLRNALLKRDPVSKSLWKDSKEFKDFCLKIVEKYAPDRKKKKELRDRIFLISSEPKERDARVSLLRDFCKELEKMLKELSQEEKFKKKFKNVSFLVKENLVPLIRSLRDLQVLSRDGKKIEELKSCSQVLERLADLDDNITFFVYVVGDPKVLEKLEKKKVALWKKVINVAVECKKFGDMVDYDYWLRA